MSAPTLPDDWAGYATVADLEERMSPSDRAAWATATELDRKRAEALLLDASHLIYATCSGAAAQSARVLKAVTVRVVQRALRERIGATNDASSVSQTTGPFTMQMSWDSPAGELFLTKQDISEVNGKGGTGAFQADLLAKMWGLK